MKLVKAIEILRNHQLDMRFAPADDLRTAVILGIEALQRIHATRSDHRCRPQATLPGEDYAG